MGWSPQFPTRFHVPRGTQDTLHSFCFSPTGFLPSMIGLPRPFDYASIASESPTTPNPKIRFGLFPLRSPLLGESSFLSLPPGT